MPIYYKNKAEMPKILKFERIFRISPVQEASSFLMIAIVLIVGTLFSGLCLAKANANLASAALIEALDKGKLSFVENNTLMPVSVPAGSESKAVKKISVIITAYSSTPEETDDTPYITAAGTDVRKGIVANNYFPFGTKIRIPELYGDKVFIVEDRMSWKKGNYHFDIWFPSHETAENFGVKRTYIEVVEW
jgi:3D (Asp-Asp-Asp) domain-containing protein